MRKTFGKLRFVDILEHCVLVGGGGGGGGPQSDADTVWEAVVGNI